MSTNKKGQNKPGINISSNIPEDVKDHLLDVQATIKKKKKIGKFGLESTIYHIVREHKRMTENNC